MDKSVLLESLSKKLLLKNYPFIKDAKLISIKNSKNRLNIKFAVYVDLKTVLDFSTVSVSFLDEFMNNTESVVPELLIKLNDSFRSHDIKSDIKSFVKMLYSERIEIGRAHV